MATDPDIPATGPEFDLDESALADGLRAGASEVYEQIVRRFGPRMLSVARRILRDDEEARDAVQQAFISAYRARHNFEAASKLSTWLHRIVVNAALMRARSRRRRPEEPLDDLLPTFSSIGRHQERFTSWAEPADKKLERAETRAMVRRAIDQLPENYRVVLLLRDIEQMSTEETATMLGLTPNAVKIRLHRARLALRKLIEPAFEEGAA